MKSLAIAGLLIGIALHAFADDRVPADFERIEELERDGKQAEAVEVCTKVLREQKSLLIRVRALNKRAALRADLKEFDAALADSDEALKFSKTDAQTHLCRGYVFEKSDRYLEAVAAYTQALELEPRCVNCLLRRAKVHAKFGYAQLAVQDYTEALNQPGRDPKLYGNRATQYFEMGEFERALEDCENYLRVIEAAYAQEAIYVYLGLSQMHLGRTRDGWDNLARAARLRGATPAEKAQKMGINCFWAGEMKYALTNLDLALSLDSTNAYSLLRRAQVRQLTGDTAAAIEDLSRSIGLGLTNAVAFCSRGMMRLVNGNRELAMADFEKAIAVEPSSAVGYSGAAYAAGLAGDRAGALQFIQRGLGSAEGKEYLFLWNALLDGPANETVRNHLSQYNVKQWPFPLVQFYEGKIAGDEVLRLAQHRNPFDRYRQLAEAYFFMGAKLLKDGDSAKAADCFKMAVASSPWLYPEERILAQKQLELHWLEKLLATH